MLNSLKIGVPAVLGVLIIGIALGSWLAGSRDAIEALISVLAAIMFLTPLTIAIIQRTRKPVTPLAKF